MNIDPILEEFNRKSVAYLLIGGMNFHLRHKSILTHDVDIWIENTKENLDRCEKALAVLNAEWGKSQEEWGPVAKLSSGWLADREEIALTCPFCPICIYTYTARKGVGSWSGANERAYTGTTEGGVSFRGMGDEDTLKDQYALAEQDRRMERIRILEEILGRKPTV